MRAESWEVTEFCRRLDECAEAVVYLIQMRLSGTGAVEDVYQETLLTAWEKRRMLNDSDKFKPWIMQIARNKCHDYFRSREQTQEVPIDPQVLALQLTSQGRAMVDEVDCVQHLWHAVEKLTPLQQEVVHLFYRQGLSIAEIARRINSPAGTVKRRLYDARQSLKQQIREDYS